MQIKLTARAKKDLDRFDARIYQKIAKALRSISTGSPPVDIKKLTNREGYRLRAGDYRIIYKREGEAIIILRIGHRREIYRSEIKKP